ncbi:MAG: RNA-guided endonuclease TnpB family protein [Magnetospirillum sp.]|nr:RNA-guided endonuclease TnpB family protein [Magnetospirillum sp.]
MLIAHRIALDPTNKQRSYFAKGAGTARFAYNWALGEWRRLYEARKTDPALPQPTDAVLRRRLNEIKRATFPWMFDVTKCAAQEAIIDLGSAFRSFFEKRGRYPRFKKKGASDSFCAANEVGTFRIEDRRIKLPVIGWVRLHESPRFDGVAKRVTVSRTADRWFASILFEVADTVADMPPISAVGVDLGVTDLAVLSDGTKIAGSKPHKKLLGRLRRANKALSRKKRGSRNALKAKRRLARIHARISNIRKDALNKLTTRLVGRYRRIGIEDLNVRGMVKNRRLARSIMDASFFELRRQLEYKARMHGATIVVADRFFASSKTCSCCGSVKAELDLSQRVYSCEDCGYEADRDINAARNLEKLAASFAVTACGEDRSGGRRKPRVKRASTKQEPDNRHAA